MGLVDSIVGKSFRDEEAGRVVVFTGDRRNRGYVVRSGAEELKIRSFLKMFYFAHLSILLLGGMLANAWSMFFVHLQEFGRPAAHLLRAEGIYLGISFLIVGLPYFFLWRSYKKALVNFVSVQDEVLVSGRSGGRQSWIVSLWLIMFGALIVLGAIFYLVGRK
jgi:hypothetical protein